MSEHQIRRCVVCGRRDKKVLLVRFARQGEQVVFDREQTEEGRGLYVHATPECFSRLTEARFWGRAFGKTGPVPSRETVLGAVSDARAWLRLEFSVTDG